MHLFVLHSKPGVKPDNDAVRKAVKETPPLIMFGSFNERMYMAEVRRAGDVRSRLLPWRDHPASHGHAFHGIFAARPIIVQEVCNALFDAFFNILPLGSEHG